jgi:hypothetical protein
MCVSVVVHTSTRVSSSLFPSASIALLCCEGWRQMIDAVEAVGEGLHTIRDG